MRSRTKVAALAAGVLLGGTATAFAALTPEGSPYPTGSAPYSIYSADFNGDGLPDVLTANGSEGTVSVYLRRAGGFTQEAGSPFGTGSGANGGPSGAAIADYDGDGLADVAVSNYTTGSIGVLLRQRGGGFVLEGQAFSAGGSPSGIATGDFNADGRPDLAVALQNAARIEIFLRNQGGGFTVQRTTYPTGSLPGQVVVGDFNGDHVPDIATVNSGSPTAPGTSVTVLIGAGGGAFTSEGQVSVGERPAGAASADFDGDGHGDLAVANYGSGTVSVLLRNAANSGFSEEAGSPIAVSATPIGIAAADLDGDGRPDLAVAANSGAVDVLHRNALGGFTRDAPTPLAGADNSVAAADFNGDGRPDLAVSEITNSTFSVLLNPAPPTPPAPTPAPVPTATPTPVPPPLAGKTVNVKPVSGTVKIKRPGSKTFVTLAAGAQIPVGSSVDTRKGRITITAAQGKGRTASADFFDGLFKLAQTAGAKPLTTLTLTEALSCPRGKASAAAKKPKTRKLWGDGSGNFRTRGHYSAATVRGTRWLVTDTCTSTTTRVAKGVVSVRDEVKRRTIILRAGKHYTARAR